MQEAVRMQLHHWELIAACDFRRSLRRLGRTLLRVQSARPAVAPQWYVRLPSDVHCRPDDEGGPENEIAMPRFGRAAQAARDKKAFDAEHNRQGAVMLDTENVVAFLLRLQPSGSQGRHCAGERPLPYHHHFVVDGIKRTGKHCARAERQCRQHHAGLPLSSPMPRKMPPTTCNRWRRRPKNSPVRYVRFRRRSRNPTASAASAVKQGR